MAMVLFQMICPFHLPFHNSCFADGFCPSLQSSFNRFGGAIPPFSKMGKSVSLRPAELNSRLPPAELDDRGRAMSNNSFHS
ncbi:unnamed protein product [Closterium sp. NIES-53]